jgi:hypothetical protein
LRECKEEMAMAAEREEKEVCSGERGKKKRSYLSV